MKKIITLTFALSMVALTGFGQSGDFGENNALHWKLANGTLTISGVGAIPDNNYPWSGYGDFTNVVIEEGVTSIGRNTFKDGILGDGKGEENIINATLPKSLTNIGYSAFENCQNLTAIILPEGLATIGGSAFKQCFALTSIVIPKGVSSIGHNAFEHCYGLRNITIRDNVNLGVIMEGNVYTCGLQLFVRCYDDKQDHGLTLTIGKNVTFPIVEGDAKLQTFSGCSNMSEIHIQDPNPPILSEDIFSKYTHAVSIPPSVYYFTYPAVDKSRCKLYVPAGSSAVYRTAAIWKDFANIIEENVTAIDNIDKKPLSLYPNPTAESVMISGLQGNEILRLYNINGNLLFSLRASGEKENIPVGHLPAGVYLVKVDNGQILKWVKK